MSFKFFRKYQKVMLWVIVVITVCTFSIFSVTSTMQTCFRPGEQPMAQFTSKYGDVVEVYDRLYRYCASQIRTMAMLTGASEINLFNDTMTYLILFHEAEKAGIRVSDGEISDWLKMNFSFLKSESEYRQVLSNLGFSSPKKFEESLREIIQVEKLKSFIRLNDDQVLSEDLYDDFKIENEEFNLAYVSFPGDRYAEEIPADSVAEEDLNTWYEKIPEGGAEVREHFSEPEKFEFDVAYLDILAADFEDYRAIVEEAGIAAIDIERDILMHYERSKDRFKIETVEDPSVEDPSVEDPSIEDPPVEDPPVEDPPVEEKSGEEKTGAEAGEGQGEGEKKDTGDEEPAGEKSDKGDQFTPYDKLSEEIKEQLANEVKLMKLVEKANNEWTEYARTKGIIGGPKPVSPEELKAKARARAEEAKGGAEKVKGGDEEGNESEGGGPRILQEEEEQESKDEGVKTGEGEQAAQEEVEEEIPPDVFFDDLLSKYRLSRDRVEGPVSLDDLQSLDRYGSEMLENRMRFLKVNNAVYFEPGPEHPYLPYFVKVTKLVERRKKGIEEVRDVALERFVNELRKEKAGAEAEVFVGAMKEKARVLPEVQKVVEQWEKDALKIAQKRIDGETEISDQKAEEIRKEELDRIQGEIDGLLAGHLYEFYDDEAAALGLGIDTLDYFRKSKIREPEYLEQEDTIEKYVMGNPMILSLGTGGISDPLLDTHTNCYVVVRVLDRRFPEPAAMTAEDYETFRRREEQMRMMRKRYPQYYPATDQVDPFSFDRIIDEYKLVYYEKEEEEQKPEEKQQTPGGMEEGEGAEEKKK